MVMEISSPVIGSFSRVAVLPVFFLLTIHGHPTTFGWEAVSRSNLGF